jgi:hypothetical protein
MTYICNLPDFPKPISNSHQNTAKSTYYRYNLPYKTPGKTSHSPSQPFVRVENVSCSNNFSLSRSRSSNSNTTAMSPPNSRTWTVVEDVPILDSVYMLEYARRFVGTEDLHSRKGTTIVNTDKVMKNKSTVFLVESGI